MSSAIKRIIIICEGPTEKEFCTDVLQPWFLKKNIFIQTPLIKKSDGGIVPWDTLKKQIESHLKQDTVAWLTLLIDYYGIPPKFKYPKWQEAHKEPNKTKRMLILENGMKEAIPDSLRNRFIPYLQLHEFEGILFSNIDVFTRNFKNEEFVEFENFRKIFETYPNPENINDRPEYAPSKRLLYHINDYNKVVYGATLAQEIGLQQIRNKCPRFNNWVEKLEAVICQ